MVDPDISELIRRLDALSRSLDKFVAEVHDDRTHLGDTYQRRDLYLLSQNQLSEDVKEIQNERREETNQRHQFTLWLVGLSTTVMMSIAMALFNFVSARGGLH